MEEKKPIAKNSNLHKAKKAKADEFYTQLSDIENECKHYKEHFKGKTILCNCDDPRVSNFFRYFSLNFEKLGLKKLICTCYKNQDIDLFSERKSLKAVYIEYEGDKNGNRQVDDEELEVKELRGDGDFRSLECVNLLKQADIVVTNPPFSLFREYVAQLMAYNKKFLIIGNQNAITYKEIFKLIKENKIWLGNNSGAWKFEVPFEKSLEENSKVTVDSNGKCWQSFGNICWFTNLSHNKRNEKLILYKNYIPEEYPKYDNYDAIEVGKVVNIPQDYDSVMGVPITFLDKYNPEQFEIIGLSASAGYDKNIVGLEFKGIKDARCIVNGKNVYARIFIRKK